MHDWTPAPTVNLWQPADQLICPLEAMPTIARSSAASGARLSLLALSGPPGRRCSHASRAGEYIHGWRTGPIYDKA